MGTRYRVDVALAPRAPCGMNSLRYLGDSWARACRAFDNTPSGFNAWGEASPAYGVVLSVWCERRRDYIWKKQKGF